MNLTREGTREGFIPSIERWGDRGGKKGYGALSYIAGRKAGQCTLEPSGDALCKANGMGKVKQQRKEMLREKRPL